MIGFPFCQFLKHQINRIFKLFIVLPNLHGIDKFNQGGEILLLYGSFIMNISDQRTIEQRLCLHPKIIASFSFAFGICDESRHQFQYVLLTMDIGKGIIMHAFFEIDGIEHLNPIWLIYHIPFFILYRFPVFSQFRRTALEHFPTFHQDRAFWIGDYIGTMHLEKV